MDFVHDQLATGRKLRILTIVDTHSRYCPATDLRFTYRGEDRDGFAAILAELAGVLAISVDHSSHFKVDETEILKHKKLPEPVKASGAFETDDQQVKLVAGGRNHLGLRTQKSRPCEAADVCDLKPQG